MAPALDPTESADKARASFLSWRLESALLEIRCSLSVVEGMARAEAVSGTLHGHRVQGNPEILCIESLEPIEAAIGTWSRDPGEIPEAVGEFHIRIAHDASGALTALCLLRTPSGTLEPAGPPLPLLHAAVPSHRRLVPDFDPAGARALPPRQSVPNESATGPAAPLFRRFWPLLAASAVVGGVASLLLLMPGARETSPIAKPAVIDAPARPLGLYVDPSVSTWRISWNSGATVLRDVKSVRLFVRDGDGQNVVELTPPDIESATYRYQPKGNDVTFRLEATDREGRIAAESFRILNSIAPVATRTDPPKGASTETTAHDTPARAIHKVAPVIAAGVRPRIRGRIPVDIRAEIDASGHVVTAVPASKPRRGLETYLTDRALSAAREWRFEPAAKNGKAVNGTHIIHFVFGH